MDTKKFIKPIFVLTLYFGIFGCMFGQSIESKPTIVPTLVLIPTDTSIPTHISIPTQTSIPTQMVTPTISSDPAAVLRSNGFVNITAGVSCKTPCRLFNHRDAQIEIFIYNNGKFDITIYRGKRMGKDIFREQFDFLQKILTALYPSDVVSLAMGNIKIADENGPSGSGDTTRAIGDYFITVKWFQNDPRMDPTISVVIWPKKG
jgi:hypothetical protein